MTTRFPGSADAVLRIMASRAEIGKGLPAREYHELKRDLMDNWIRWREIP